MTIEELKEEFEEDFSNLDNIYLISEASFKDLYEMLVEKLKRIVEREDGVN